MFGKNKLQAAGGGTPANQQQSTGGHFGSAQSGASSVGASQEQASFDKPQEENKEPGKLRSMQEFHRDILKKGKKKLPKFLLPLVAVVVVLLVVGIILLNYFRSQGEGLLGKKGEILDYIVVLLRFVTYFLELFMEIA